VCSTVISGCPPVHPYLNNAPPHPPRQIEPEDPTRTRPPPGALKAFQRQAQQSWVGHTSASCRSLRPDCSAQGPPARPGHNAHGMCTDTDLGCSPEVRTPAVRHPGGWEVVRRQTSGEDGERLAVRWSDEARPATAPWRRQVATTVEVSPRTFAATHRSRPLLGPGLTAEGTDTMAPVFTSAHPRLQSTSRADIRAGFRCASCEGAVAASSVTSPRSAPTSNPVPCPAGAT
jgi:hypothetical protein